MARDLIILMRAISITRAIGRSGPWNRDFFGPWNCNELSECNLGPKKSRRCDRFFLLHDCMNTSMCGANGADFAAQFSDPPPPRQLQGPQLGGRGGGRGIDANLRQVLPKTYTVQLNCCREHFALSGHGSIVRNWNWDEMPQPVQKMSVKTHRLSWRHILFYHCVPTVRLDDENCFSSLYEGKYHQEVHPCDKEIHEFSFFELCCAPKMADRGGGGGGDSFQFPRQNVFEVHGGLYTVSLRDTDLSRFVLYKWYGLQNIFIYTAYESQGLDVG